MQKAERKKIMKKKRIFALVMVLTLVLTSTMFAFAEVQPRETATVVFDINRVSRTSAEATAIFTFTTIVDLYNVKIYLQKKVNGVWVSDANNPEYFYGISGEDDYGFAFNHEYSNLETGVNYRLKCVSTDYIGSNSDTFTCYSDQF